MLEIIPVVHVGGTTEYDYHPGQVAPTSKDFAVKRTTGYLINYNSNKRNFQRSKVTSSRTIYCDSGGLQLGTVGWQKGLTPGEVQAWQNGNCDVGFVLDDLSPFRKPGDERIELPVLAGRIAEAGTGPVFEKAAKNTAFNLNQQMKTKDEKTKLFCILQGFSTEQIQFWYNIVTQDHDLDGFGMKAIAPRSTIEALAWAWENVDRPIHILGNGRIGRTYPLVLFGTKFKHRLTADSTSWYTGAMHRRFYKALGDLNYGTPEVDGKVTLNGPPLLACSCVVCEWGNELLESGKLTQDQYLFAHILSTHNWQMMFDDHLYVSELAKKPDLFREYAESFVRYGEDMGTMLTDPITAVDMVDAITSIHDGNGAKAVQKYCLRNQQAEAFF